VWQVWNTTNGASRRIYRAAVSADNELGRLAFAPDSGLVALADNGAVKLWDLKRGMPRQLMKAGIGNEVRLAFSGDGSQLAVAVDNGVVLYEMPSGRQRLGVVLLLERPEAVAFSPDGRTVAVAGGPGKTIVFAAETGQSQRELVSLPGSSLLNRIGCLVFSPDGGLLAGIGGGDLALWNVEQGALVAHERQPHGSHPNGAFCPGASGLLAVTGQPDGAVRFWSLPTKTWRGQVQTGHQGGMSALAFSPDGALLATAGLLLDPAAARVRLWEVAKYLEGGEVKSSTPP
jgi:WD40 repeat protein